MARCVCDIGVGGGGGGVWKKKKHKQPLQMQQLGECVKTIFWEEENLLEVKTFRAFRNPEYMKLTNGSYSSRVFLIS